MEMAVPPSSWMVLVRRVPGSPVRGDEWFNLVGLAAETEEKDGGEVWVRGVADEDAAEEVGWFPVLGHAAASAVRDGDDAVDVGVGGQDLGGEVGCDAAGHRGRTVDGGEDADVVAGSDAALERMMPWKVAGASKSAVGWDSEPMA